MNNVLFIYNKDLRRWTHNNELSITQSKILFGKLIQFNLEEGQKSRLLRLSKTLKRPKDIA